MPKYFYGMKRTDQGVKNFREAVDRAEANIDAAEKMGAKDVRIYWAAGSPYDLVAFGEWPNDETLTAFGLALEAQGNVRITGFRVFDADEMRGIIGSIPR